MMRAIRGIPKLNFAFVGGEDLIRSPSGLSKGVQYVDFLDKILVVPRDASPMKRKKYLQYPLANDIIVLDKADTEGSVSSTRVRQLLKDQKFKELEKILNPETLNYLIGCA